MQGQLGSFLDVLCCHEKKSYDNVKGDQNGLLKIMMMKAQIPQSSEKIALFHGETLRSEKDHRIWAWIVTTRHPLKSLCISLDVFPNLGRY